MSHLKFKIHCTRCHHKGNKYIPEHYPMELAHCPGCNRTGTLVIKKEWEK
jgi:NAD-dependent SIR2 family protein deacetylase